jgi:hypothetical protein
MLIVVVIPGKNNVCDLCTLSFFELSLTSYNIEVTRKTCLYYLQRCNYKIYFKYFDFFRTNTINMLKNRYNT